jgi:hypothetical protein
LGLLLARIKSRLEDVDHDDGDPMAMKVLAEMEGNIRTNIPERSPDLTIVFQHRKPSSPPFDSTPVQ